MSLAGAGVHADELDAVQEPDTAGEEVWSVWCGATRVGVLEQHRAGGSVWVAGRVAGVDEDLVAEGPTALCVLRRLACLRAHARCTVAADSSPVRT